MKVEEYKEAIKGLQKCESYLRKCMQEVCDHHDLEFRSGGDSGDGDKSYSVTCKICGKYASYMQGYSSEKHNGEKDYEEYRELSKCKYNKKGVA